MESLNVVQRWFSAVVTHPNGVAAGIESEEAYRLAPISRHELERIITRSKKMSAHERLSIYAHAYYARLIECLGESFPVLKRTLGDDVFNGFAFGYLQRYPSRSYTLGRLGENFSRYLDETRPDSGDVAGVGVKAAGGWPDFLIDLAHLEWTIEQVFDGPGVEGKPTLEAGILLSVQPERWPDIRLRPVKCLRLLRFRFPVLDYYAAVRGTGEQNEVSPPGPADSYAAITRRDWVVRLHELSEPQFELLSGLIQGDPLAEAIERAFETCGSSDRMSPNDLRIWFNEWSRQQFFEGIDLP